MSKRPKAGEVDLADVDRRPLPSGWSPDIVDSAPNPLDVPDADVDPEA